LSAFSIPIVFAMPPKPKRKDADVTENLTRIAIVNDDKCKPKRCRQECKKSCPGQRNNFL